MEDVAKTQTSRQRTVANHRRRLADRGISRFEVRGSATDKELVRGLAKRLAANDAETACVRVEVERAIGEAPLTGQHIWEALRRSPLVGADLNLEREVVPPRDVDP